MAGFDDSRPIFLQLAEMLEEGIISGAYPEEGQIPSITEYSAALKINPATALKGINLLVDAGLVYKKRGVGMFVAQGAAQRLREKRKQGFYQHYVTGLVAEAKRLHIGKTELLGLVEQGFAQEEEL